MSQQLTSRRTRTPLLKAATRSAVSSTGQYLGEAHGRVRSLGQRALPACPEGVPTGEKTAARPPAGPPGRVSEARGGEVLHHRGIEELLGGPHDCQQRIQVSGAAVWAESRRRCLWAREVPERPGSELLGYWARDPSTHHPPAPGTGMKAAGAARRAGALGWPDPGGSSLGGSAGSPHLGTGPCL